MTALARLIDHTRGWWFVRTSIKQRFLSWQPVLVACPRSCGGNLSLLLLILTGGVLQGQEPAPGSNDQSEVKSQIRLRLNAETIEILKTIPGGWEVPNVQNADVRAHQDRPWISQVVYQSKLPSGEPDRLPKKTGVLQLNASSRVKEIRGEKEITEEKETAPLKEQDTTRNSKSDESRSDTQKREVKSSPIKTRLSDTDSELTENKLRPPKDPEDAPGTSPVGNATLNEGLELSASKGASDVGKECPGAPNGEAPQHETQPDDVPLEPSKHPYDAPAAKSDAESQSHRTQPVETFSQRELVMRERICDCLEYFMTHPETVTRRGPWALMHAALPFGVETEVIAGNRRVNAIGWMCFNGTCARQRMFQPTRSGFRTNVGPGVQGHEGQFLAILAQSRVQSSYPIRIGSRKYTIRDLVQYEMATCREKSELTFKLIGLSYYLDQNHRWRDNRGRSWNLEKMVAEELAQPINGAACGGSHRLMGLSFALIERKKAGLPITGHWKRAEDYLNDYVNYTLTLQNPDGSFSTEWFESRGRDPDVERKVQTTGHMLEWLIFTLPDDYLRSPRIQKSVEFLLSSVGRRPSHDWPIGPRGHALRALALYNQRVFGAEAGKLQALLAERDGKPALR